MYTYLYRCCRLLLRSKVESFQDHLTQVPIQFSFIKSANQCNAVDISSGATHFPYPLSASKKMANALAAVYKWGIPVAIGASFVQASLYDVKGGTRAVIFDRLSGVQEKVVNEGTHFLIPWLQKSIIYDVRTKPRNISTTTGSKDLQMVSLTLRVLHRPEVQQLPKIYQVFTLTFGHLLDLSSI